MKLTYLYQPVVDLAAAVDFHRTHLGWKEAWRDGDETVAFWLPDRSAQVMLSTSGKAPGPMYRVDDVTGWLADHPDLVVVVPQESIPGGSVVGFETPGEHVTYVFDRAT